MSKTINWVRFLFHEADKTPPTFVHGVPNADSAGVGKTLWNIRLQLARSSPSCTFELAKMSNTVH